jgi:hypothetical protein
MTKRRRMKPLPLPRSWLARPQWTGEKRDLRDTALDARFPRPGTKANLKILLLTAGWEEEALQKPALDITRTRLFDLPAEQSKKRDPDIDSAVTELRKLQLKVDPVKRKDPKAPTQWAKDMWDSMTRNPWWLSGTGGQRSLFIVSQTAERLEMASSLFIHDIWSNLGEEPAWRMPVFRRMSLVALMSPETLNHFMEGPGAATDLLIIHGGFLDEDSMYQSLAYLAAVQSLFKGFLIYEAVVPRGDDPARVADVARRSGFPTVMGVG